MKKVTKLTLFFVQFIASAQSPYTILISFDGFRYDYMDRGITPNLWKVAENGVKALSLRPSFPSITFPNHYSIITGMYPENHGLINNTMYNPVTGATYRLNDSLAVQDPSWYQGEAFWETAQRYGITTASFFWPGSEINLEYRRPKYFKKYDHNYPYKKRVDGILEWLSMPLAERPRFLTLYFDATDSYGHKFGTDSDSTNKAISILDDVTGYLLDKLKAANLLDSTNLIFVSDHGMTAIDKSKFVDVTPFIEGEKYKIWAEGTYLLIEPETGNEESVYQKLKKNETHYKVYRREEMPAFYHFSSNPLISKIIAVADIGWEIGGTEAKQKFERWNSGGVHGFDNNNIQMHGLFLAMGPSFKKNYRIGTVWNIDIYPLLCEIFNIPIPRKIDGRAERIDFILNKF